MESANPLQPLTPFILELWPEANPFDIGPAVANGTGRVVLASFDRTPLLLDPVPENNDGETGDRLLAGPLQNAIAPPPIDPPLPEQPPSPPADPIVGATFVVNQEAVNFTTDGNNASADGTPGWHLRSDVRPEADANITNVWAQGVRGRNVVIGIIDSGFEIEDPEKDLLAHPHLKTNYRADLSYDFDEGDEGDEYPSRIINREIEYESRTLRTIRNNQQEGSDFPLDVKVGKDVINVNLNVEIEHKHQESGLDVYLYAPQEDENQLDEERPHVQVLWDVGSGEYYDINVTEYFQEIDVDGIWKLQIKDNDTEQKKRGKLLHWSLEFETEQDHGTAVAGVAAASEKEGINIRGVAPEAEWAGLRMGADGTDDEEMVRALSHKNDEIDIYNNSWGTQFFEQFTQAEAALERAVKEGRGGLGNIYVFSGGNAGQEKEGTPHSNVNYNDLANSRHTIAVAAIGEDGKQAVYSESGAPLLVSAYSKSGREGDRAISTTGRYSEDGDDSNDYIHEFGGTSASAPIVSGVIALMLEVNPLLTSRDVQHIIVETANKNDPGDNEWSENGAGYSVNYKYGFGAIDAEAAVALARNWTSVGPEISVSQHQDIDGEIPEYDPDDPKDPLTSTITINNEDDMTIEWVEVEFDVTHGYLGQLEIVLISPDGTESILAESDNHGKYTRDDDYYKWTFTSARHWGESPVGEWTLKVADVDDANDGRKEGKENTWHSWGLNIYGTQPTVSVEATDPDASEDGDSGQLTFTRTGKTTHPLTVHYSASGTATAGSDYSTIGEIVFPAGSSEVTVPIAPIDDDEVEEDEILVVDLEAGTGYKLGDESSAEVSIADNDRQNSLADLTIAALSNPTTVTPRGALTYTLFVVNSGSETATDISISNTLPVEFSLLNVNSGGNFVPDTSTPGIVSFTDGSLISGEFATLTISGNVSPDAVGSITNSVVVDPDNQIPETDEDNNTATAITTIQAIAPLPVVTISATDADASEDGDAGEFTVARSGDTTESLEVSYSTAGDATAGSDYSTIGEIVIPAGSQEVRVAIAPIDDDEVEESETVEVVLDADDAYAIGTNSSATVNIADNDVGPLVLEAGNPDNFDQADGQEGENPLTTTPGEPRPFDGDGLNQSFTHRFDLSEALAAGEIVSATFETKIKRIAGANDTIEFGNFSDPENLPAWGSYIGKGGVATTWLDDAWTSGEAIEFNLDMSALSAFDVNTDAPTRSRNLLPMMNNLGFLDVTIEDDSMVDYVRLTVEVAPTEGPLPYVVTNTNDSGAGSLRSAIGWANDNPGRDTILFDIPGDGPHTIAPASALPDIAEAVVIDGWSQNGGTPPATPLIELSGSNAGRDLSGNFRDGLKITGSNVEVRGLVINKWGYGIRIIGESATDNWIYGNFIGTNVDGTSSAPNWYSVSIGEYAGNYAGNNIIGTNGDGIADTAEANLISGSYRLGIVINSDSNIVAGNRIGTNQDGSASIGDASLIVRGNNNIIGTNGDAIADAAEANLISGGGITGVAISGKFNAVAGNLIGTNLEGNAAIGGNSPGLQVSGDHNIIGTNSDGTADAIEGNLISGNGENGVKINGDFNVVAGNRIGTNLEGNAAISNELDGVQVSGDNNIIGTNGDGTADADETNLISGNAMNGVEISGNSNIVAGNHIGTNLDGTGAIANGIAGVVISGHNNRIGGSNTAEGNIIAFNRYDGVEIFQGTGNRIQGNAIFSNTGLGNSRGLGIELNYDGVTANDIGDSDTGVNNLQNFPELTLATSDTATTTIQGTLNSTGNTTFTLEFFANSTLDDSGYGEGETFLGSQEVTTDSDGDASFAVNFTTPVAAGHFITATATDPDGNTSEFSQGVEVEAVQPFADIGTLLTDVDIDDGSIDWGDYDDDGDLDILLTGETWKVQNSRGYYERIAKIYQNNNGSFIDIGVSLENIAQGSTDWGDYDNDGDLDILLAGEKTSHVTHLTDVTPYDAIAKVYRNDNGNFIDTNATIKDVGYSSTAWGDYDNDGDLDMLLTGITEDDTRNNTISRIYRNDDGTFTDIGANLIGVSYGSAAWGDYDNDRDLDILLTGGTDIYGGVARIYRNDSGSFTDIAAGLVGVDYSDATWGDYDNDGDLDIALTGNDYWANDDRSITKIYRNDNGNFTEMSSSIIGVRFGSVAWGDYDNDGDLDLVLAGFNYETSTRILKIYRNDSGNFTDIDADLRGMRRGAAVWGDYDNDRDLDLALVGYDAKVYQNQIPTANEVPTVPTDLNAVVNNNSVTLNWDPAMDPETPQSGLTYNLRVGTTPGGSEIVSPMASNTGERKVAKMGNVNHNQDWTLNYLLPGTYYWSVQAIDTAFAGSAFAPEGSFTIETALKPIVEIGVTDTWLHENEEKTTEIIVARRGDTTAPLAVNYTVTGTATPGVDYQALSGSVTIPAGASTATIPLTVIDEDRDDPVDEGDETAIVTLTPDGSYEIGSKTATVTIEDGARARVSISAEVIG